MSIKFAKGSGSMVEQRSPKPSVACSSRVSPAKRSPIGLLFSFIRDSNTQRIRDGTMSVRLRLHVTRRFANTFASLCYFSRFALSRVASPLPKEVPWDFFFHLFAIRTHNAFATERCPCYLFIDYHFQSY